MHNVKRMSADKRAEMRKENEERAKQYSEMSRSVMAMRARSQYDQAALDGAARLLRANPDMATVWNFRRQVLEHMYATRDCDGGVSDARKPACEGEFSLTQECLAVNPKSYPVWFHREWILVWGQCSYQWKTELKLTAKLLALDDRNFHCWTYRRAVVKLAGVAPAAELEFTTTKIEQNFSNYSAWHYRTKLFHAIYGVSNGMTSALSPDCRARLLEELQLVRNAFFTAPEDSSAWFYHRWLLAQLGALDSTSEHSRAPSEQYVAVLKDELAMVEELIDLEPESKWPLISAVHIGRILSENDPALTGRTSEWLSRLLQVDPTRAMYYRHLLGDQATTISS